MMRLMLILVVAATIGAANAEITPDQREFFESHIRPVLAQDCYECHSTGGKSKGGLILDHREAMLVGGDSGVVMVPGDPESSLLMRAIRHETEDLAMPKAGVKLDDEIIENFSAWIAMGAPDPRDGPPSKAELATDTDWEAVRERRQQWWSFQPIEEVKLPEVADKAWAQHPIDRFVAAKWAEAGLRPAEVADGRTLARRLYFVLTGLPPTGEEMKAFAGAWDEDPDAATERLVDELLASPQFGERWARHWMDWIRYAESHGSEGDPPIVNAWHYRDYLVRALNADVPYDQLVREHMAGDLIESPRVNRELGINESAIGPAHWRMVFHGFAPTDALDERVRFTDDQINVFTKAFLGLTVSCARCHDHKFDAISQADYYALYGILGSTRPGRVAIELPERRGMHRDELAKLKPEIRAGVAEAWLKAAPAVTARLLDLEERAGKEAPKGPKKGATAKGETNAVLEPWFLMRREAKEKEAFEKAWALRIDAWMELKARVAEHESRDYRKRWDLSRSADHADWFRHGDGLNDQPGEAGTFTVGEAGAPAIADIFPAGVYSHELSTKHGATLTSRDVHLDGEYDLWLRIAGGGGAMARYVVQNYPRNGTVYPVTSLTGGWRWQKYNKLDYWNGDEVHIELTTAQDAALLAKNTARSWFGIREAVFVKKDGAGPVSESREEWGPLFEAAGNSDPRSMEDLAEVYVDALAEAVRGWRDGDMTDGQALFLNGMLRAGLLPNAVEELGAAGELIAEYRTLEEAIPVATRVPGLVETAAFDQALYERGDHKKPGAAVPRRFLESIDSSPYDTALSGRTELAEDLLRGDNPFTRRVIVNRLWHHVFGRGLVVTTDNFGRMGAKPSHPELLDYLATRLEEEGWSLKKMIRLLVTSRTFALSSETPAGAEELDSNNAFLSHAPVRRLEAEAIRDALLVVSGKLDRDEMFGPPVEGDANRRSVYVKIIRNRMDPFLTSFDAPVPASSVGRRDVTNVPGQSLTMLNSAFVRRLAEEWGRRVAREPGDDEAKIGRMWGDAFGRKATADEIAGVLTFMNDFRRTQDAESTKFLKAGNLMAELKSEVKGILDPARAQILADRGAGTATADLPAVAPMGWWKFDDDLRDAAGSLHAEAVGDVSLEDGSLVLKGSGYVETGPLRKPLRAKTLEALVQLDGLEQGGGGVVTVQDLRGRTFDSIVYAERLPRRWMAGSNTSTRTLPFKGEDEEVATDQPVWVAIAYDEDGTIRGYRNGEPYGQPVRKSDLVAFEGGEAQVLFGLRHGTSASGNRPLKGRILEARLYDRALSADELAASAKGTGGAFVSKKEVLASLSGEKRDTVAALEHEIGKLEKVLRQAPKPVAEDAAWQELAHSIFNFKEFIYLR